MSLQNVQNQIYVGDTLSQFIEYQMPTPALIKEVLK